MALVARQARQEIAPPCATGAFGCAETACRPIQAPSGGGRIWGSPFPVVRADDENFAPFWQSSAYSHFWRPLEFLPFERTTAALILSLHQNRPRTPHEGMRPTGLRVESVVCRPGAHSRRWVLKMVLLSGCHGFLRGENRRRRRVPKSAVIPVDPIPCARHPPLCARGRIRCQTLRVAGRNDPGVRAPLKLRQNELRSAPDWSGVRETARGLAHSTTLARPPGHFDHMLVRDRKPVLGAVFNNL
jgi:hypothetical protein